MKNQSLKYVLGFIATGVVILSFVFYVQREMFAMYEHDLPYFNLGDNVNNKVAQGGLLYEKTLHNNTSNFEKDVLPIFTSARTLLENAYSGGQTELEGRFLHADEETKLILKQALVDLDNLIEVMKDNLVVGQGTSSINRFDSTFTQQPVQKSGKFNLEVDSAFKEFQATAARLSKRIARIVSTDYDHLRIISWLSIVLVVVLFGFLGALFYRWQQNNEALYKNTLARLDVQANITEGLSNFVEAVSEGNFSIELALAGDDGSLTNKLITMRDKLKENAEGERKRGWSTMGMAQIGEILRSNTSSTVALYDNIIGFLVKYTKSNQGGLFILNDDDDDHKYLELAACVAFERKKYLTKMVELGEGLIGQCYLEAERIHLQEMPENYIAIGSGLGGARPKSLLLVPMKLDNKVFGVIELATFREYEDFEIDLVEKLAESIASAISTVRTNYSTRTLLERTQQQAEEMKSQEEEIRQNMEELEATQEEMQRKNKIMEGELAEHKKQTDDLRIKDEKLTESQAALQGIINNIPRAIFWKDKDLKFAGCNHIFAQIAGVDSYRDILGKTDFDMTWGNQAEAYRKDDMEVMRSKRPKLDIEEVNVNSKGEETWVLTSKVPILNPKDEVISILGMFEDITERKKKDADIAKKLEQREKFMSEIQHLKKLLELKR